MPRKNRQTKATRTTFNLGGDCFHKKRYTNELIAKRDAEAMQLGSFDLELSVYKCQRCGGWHLTSRQSQ